MFLTIFFFVFSLHNLSAQMQVLRLDFLVLLDVVVVIGVAVLFRAVFEVLLLKQLQQH